MTGAKKIKGKGSAAAGAGRPGRLWDKGIPLDESVLAYTVGDDFLLDQKLVKYDCLGSIAHARMLEKIGILKKGEAEKIVAVLEEIKALASQGKFQISRSDEDCHTAIENNLTKKLGDLGKKIHTGRSRNDQVLTALRLYYKVELEECAKLARAFSKAAARFVEQHGGIRVPGYTHTRKAMPSSIALWGNAFIDSMGDNLELLNAVYALMDQSPLGTGAGYGVPLPLDREYAANLLGFNRVQENPIYAQLSRGKFESSILHALSQIMFDLNRMASDLILFSMPAFGYFELPEEFCTGSSMMPQKKNPDVLELVRANYHACLACEFELKSIAANLISGYHRDLQLTKGAVMKGISLAKDSLSVMASLIEKLKVNKKRCEEDLTPELFATEKALALAEQGVPFRDAYQKVAKNFTT